MPTFGNTNLTATPRTIWDSIVGLKATLPVAGKVTSITAHAGGIVAAAKCAIYRVSDNALMGSTPEANLPFVSAWTTWPFASPLSLSATSYFICIWCGNAGSTVMTDATVGANTLYGQALAYGAWPNPYVPVDTSKTSASIYATYDVAGVVGDYLRRLLELESAEHLLGAALTAGKDEWAAVVAYLTAG